MVHTVRLVTHPPAHDFKCLPQENRALQSALQLPSCSSCARSCQLCCHLLESSAEKGRDPPWHRAEGQPGVPGWTHSAETKQRGFASLRFSPKDRHTALVSHAVSPRSAAGCVSPAAAAPVARSAHPVPGSITRLPPPRTSPSALRSDRAAATAPSRTPSSTDSAMEPRQTKGAPLIFDEIQTN